MAQITVTIEAETGQDVRQAMREFLGDEGPVFTPSAGLPAPTGVQTETEIAEAGERQKRSRRTKAEMEAARAGLPVQTAISEAVSSENHANAALEKASSAGDVFSEQVREAIADELNEAIGKDTIGNLAREAVNKIGAPAVRDIYRKHGHSEKLGDMDAKYYGAVHAAMSEAMAAS